MFNSRSATARPAGQRDSEPTIALDELRVGMFIHLDGGWLSHPFARSSFKIANAQQIATLRGLKLARVRWSPELSDAMPAGGGTLPAGRHGAGPGAELDDPAPGVAPAAGRADDAAGHPPADATPVAPTDPAAAAAATARAATLAAERLVQQQCEQQFAEAATAWRRASDALPGRPEAARDGADELAQALTEKLMVDGDVGIRLLPGGGNDRAAAHALNVTVVSMLLARSLGLGRDDLAHIALGALLHDVGKLELPERARHIEAGCSTAETNAYREHVTRGISIARRMGLPEGALEVIAQHHEHADGTGFPARMSGDRMSLAGRIVSIVNRYDNLCNPATRTPPLTPHEAVAMLFAHGRTRYDASVLNAFIRMMGVDPAASLAQLTDERYAMVVAGTSTRPLKPRLLVHEAGVPRL